MDFRLNLKASTNQTSLWVSFCWIMPFIVNVYLFRPWEASGWGWLLPGHPAPAQADELHHRGDDEAAAAADNGGAGGHWGADRQEDEQRDEERQCPCQVITKKKSYKYSTKNLWRQHWPNGILPYTIDAAFTASERAIIAAGMKMITDNSCIRF